MTGMRASLITVRACLDGCALVANGRHQASGTSIKGIRLVRVSQGIGIQGFMNHPFDAALPRCMEAQT